MSQYYYNGSEIDIKLRNQNKNRCNGDRELSKCFKIVGKNVRYDICITE